MTRFFGHHNVFSPYETIVYNILTTLDLHTKWMRLEMYVMNTFNTFSCRIIFHEFQMTSDQLSQSLSLSFIPFMPHNPPFLVITPPSRLDHHPFLHWHPSKQCIRWIFFQPCAFFSLKQIKLFLYYVFLIWPTTHTLSTLLLLFMMFSWSFYFQNNWIWWGQLCHPTSVLFGSLLVCFLALLSNLFIPFQMASRFWELMLAPLHSFCFYSWKP